MVGLVLIGAAGAFAYRSMFGGAILAPSLPPIIKANDAPNKIVPNRSDAQTGRRTRPVQRHPARPKNWCRARSSRSRSSRRMRRRAWFRQFRCRRRRVLSRPAHPPPLHPRRPRLRRCRAPPKVGAPGQPPAAPAGSGGEPKKVHTVTIRSDQVGNANAQLPRRRLPPLGRQRGRRRKRPPGQQPPRAAATRRSPSSRAPKGQRRHRLRSRRRAPTWHGRRHPAPRSPQPRSPQHLSRAGGRRLCGPGHLAAQRGRGPDRVPGASGQIPRASSAVASR